MCMPFICFTQVDCGDKPRYDGSKFDDKGNFIVINSSGINKKLADNVGYSIKTSYVLNLIDILPKSIDLPSNKKLANLPLTQQIKEISKYVVMVKVK